jgi:hypothetical protein
LSYRRYTKTISDKDNSPALNLLVRNKDNDSFYVYIGPVWALKNIDVELKIGNFITVKGSRIIYKNKETVIATVVQKDKEFMMLLDSNGNPLK